MKFIFIILGEIFYIFKMSPLKFYLYKAVVFWVFIRQAVFLQRFLDSERGHVLIGHEKSLIRYIGLQRFAKNLQRAASVAIFDLLEFILQLLLPTSRHHNLRIGDGSREVAIGHFFIQVFSHVYFVFLKKSD